MYYFWEDVFECVFLLLEKYRELFNKKCFDYYYDYVWDFFFIYSLIYF